MAEENEGSPRLTNTDPVNLQEMQAVPEVESSLGISPELAQWMNANPIGAAAAGPPPEANPYSIRNKYIDKQVRGLDVDNDPFSGSKRVQGDFRNPHYQNQLYERYSSHPNFDKLGFNPFRDNEALYNKESSTFDELRRASGEWATLAGLGLQDVMHWGSFENADRKTAASFERAMAIGSSSKGGLGGFTTNLYLNSGYTVGIMGELALEELAMFGLQAGLTFVSGTTFGSTVAAQISLGAVQAARAARAVGKIGSALDKGKKLMRTMDSLKDISVVRSAWNGSKKALNFINPLENTFNFLRHGRKTEDLNSLVKAGRGVGAVYRDVLNARLAWSEGGLEGGMVELQMERDLLAQFKETHDGRSPNKLEAAEIRKAAHSAGVTTGWINAPVIALTNKLTFDGLVRGKYKRLASDVLDTGKARKILFNPRKGIPEAYKALPKDYFKVKWEYIKNPKLIAKSLGTYGRANLAEGIQELSQNVIGGTQSDYYTAKYQGNAVKGGYYKYLAGQMIKQVSPMGFETFASGFLMGGMIHPISNTMAAIRDGKKGFEGTIGGTLAEYAEDLTAKVKYRKDEDGYAAYKKQKQDIENEEIRIIEKDVNMLDEVYKKTLDYYSPSLNNLVAQKEYKSAMELAQANNDKKMFFDMQNSAHIEHVTAALQYGQIDMHLELLEDMKKPNADELQGLSTMEHSEYVAKIDNAINNAKNIKAAWDVAQEKFRNPHDPWIYTNGSEEFHNARRKKAAWDAGINEMVFNQATFQNILERQTGILDSAHKDSGLKNTPYRDFNVLFTLGGVMDEIKLLNQELGIGLPVGLTKVEALTDELTALVAQKTEKLEKLKAFDKAMKGVYTDIKKYAGTESLDPATYDAVKKAYTEYLAVIAKNNGDFTNLDAVNKSFEKILDYHFLGKRAGDANAAVNMLLDPKNFLDAYDRHLENIEVLDGNRKVELQKSLEMYTELQLKNKMLAEVFKLGVFFNVDDLVALEEEGRLPDNFYAHDSGTAKDADEVEIKGELYDKVVAILERYQKRSLSNKLITERIASKYSTFSRFKGDGEDGTVKDERTYADIAKQFGFDPELGSTEIALTQVLKAIVESKYSSPREVALAKKLLEIKIDENETVKFSKTESQGGSYSLHEQTVIDARYSSNEYGPGEFGPPIEHVILHAEVTRRTIESLDEDAEFKSQMQDLHKEAIASFTTLDPGTQQSLTEGTEGGFHGLSSLEAFVADAMSNDQFQQFLATVISEKKTKPSLWKQFVDLVYDNLKKFFGDGKVPSGTVLNAALNLITAKIDATFGAAGGKTTTGTDPTPGATPGAVTRDISITELKSDKHKELYVSLLALYNMRYAEMDVLIAEEQFPDWATMSDEDKVNSKQFKRWLRDSSVTSKEDVIIAYNLGQAKATAIAKERMKKKKKPATKEDIEQRAAEATANIVQDVAEVTEDTDAINKIAGEPSASTIEALNAESTLVSEAEEKETIARLEKENKAEIEALEDPAFLNDESREEEWDEKAKALEEKMPGRFAFRLTEDKIDIFYSRTNASQLGTGQLHKQPQPYKVGEKTSVQTDNGMFPVVITKVNANGKILEASEGDGTIVIYNGVVLSSAKIRGIRDLKESTEEAGAGSTTYTTEYVDAQGKSTVVQYATEKEVIAEIKRLKNVELAALKPKKKPGSVSIIDTEMRTALVNLDYPHHVIDKLSYAVAQGIVENEKYYKEVVEEDPSTDPSIIEQVEHVNREIRAQIAGISNYENYKDVDGSVVGLIGDIAHIETESIISDEEIKSLLAAKLKELQEDVSFDAMYEGEVVIMNNGHNTQATIINKDETARTITVRHMTKSQHQPAPIPEEKLQTKINARWNPARNHPDQEIEDFEVTPQENELAKETVTTAVEMVLNADVGNDALKKAESGESEEDSSWLDSDNINQC